MKKLSIAITVVILAGCSTFGPGPANPTGKHPTDLGNIYRGGG